MLKLDGTGSIDLNRKAFGDHMTEHRFAVPRDAHVIQADRKGFSRQSLTGCDRHGNPISEQKIQEAQRLREHVVELLSMLPGEVLLVTYKQVEEMLLDQLPPNVSTAHFGALRGLNAFETCETVVVLGREQPSAPAIEALARPFTATDPEPFIPIGEYVPQSRGRGTRDDAPNVVEVPVHPDPRCQAMLEQVREAEIAQAVDRVRPVFNKRNIILLTSLPLNITVDEAVPWKDMRPSRFAIAYARHGVLPLSASKLARCFPDLWPNAEVAKKDIQRAGLNGDKPQIVYLFGKCPHSISAPRTAVCRRHGQRGRSTRVLVSPELPDARRAVESLVGKLAEFHLEQPTVPPPRERPLAPMAATLAAEAHLLATTSPEERPPDMLGFAGVMKLLWQMLPATAGRPQARGLAA